MGVDTPGVGLDGVDTPGVGEDVAECDMCSSWMLQLVDGCIIPLMDACSLASAQ